MAYGWNEIVGLISGDAMDVTRTNVPYLHVISPATMSGDLSNNTKEDHRGKWFIILSSWPHICPSIRPVLFYTHFLLHSGLQGLLESIPALFDAKRGLHPWTRRQFIAGPHNHSHSRSLLRPVCHLTRMFLNSGWKPESPDSTTRLLTITACLTFCTKYKIKGPADIIVHEHTVKTQALCTYKHEHALDALYSLAPRQQLMWWFHIRQQILLPPVLWPGSTVGCCRVFNVNNNMWGYFK